VGCKASQKREAEEEMDISILGKSGPSVYIMRNAPKSSSHFIIDILRMGKYVLKRRLVCCVVVKCSKTHTQTHNKK
jgi:hypothetical protein